MTENEFDFRSFFFWPRIEGKDVIYFDSAATSLRLKDAVLTMMNFYENFNSNIHRSANPLSTKATEMLENARAFILRYLDPLEDGYVVFTQNTTEALNVACECLGSSLLKQGDCVLLSEFEHHSNLLPWIRLSKTKGVKLEFVPPPQDDLIFEEIFFEFVDRHRPKIVSLSHVSNVLGSEIDIKRIGKELRSRKIIFVVDGAQALPHLSVNLSHVDCYAFSSHKCFGPFGVGVLWIRKELADELEPLKVGGGTIVDSSLSDYKLADPPYRFEAGTLPVAEAIALAKALDWLKQNFSSWSKREADLRDYFLRRAKDLEALKLLFLRPSVPVFSFFVDNYDLTALNLILGSRGICLRLGHHCAIPLHKRFAIRETLRVSLAGYNSREEIDHFFTVLEESLKKNKVTVSVEFQQDSESNKPEIWAERLSNLEDDELVEYLVDLSSKTQIPDSQLLIENNLVPGCMSRVYIWSSDQPPYFDGWSESSTLTGLILVLKKVAKNFDRDSLLNFNFLAFLDSVNIFRALTTNRRFGVANMIDKIKLVVSLGHEQRGEQF